jgi:cardiolipin synthase A/B
MQSWTWIFLASEWVIRAVLFVYVLHRRSPAAARSWLLLILAEPYVGLILYWLLGRAYLPKWRIDLQQQASQLIRRHGAEFFGRHKIHPQVPSDFLQAVTLAKNLGDFDILGGNRFELLSDYDGTIDRLVCDIRAAKLHVHLLYYIFADDSTGRRVADALMEAAQRGVTCRVLMDSLASRRAIRSLAPAMRAAGIEVLEMLPVRFFLFHRSRPDLRNHRKIAVIDGRVAYVGSQNIINADFKKGFVYKELVARVTGPVALQLQAIFLTDHYLETRTRDYPQSLFPEPAVEGTAVAQALPSGPGYRHANNQRLIVALLYAARTRVVITTPYFVPDDALLQAIQAAVLRGVEVDLVVSQRLDQVLVGLCQRSFYEELLEAGVRIHEYRSGLLHAKHVSIDDSIALIGSSNLDIRSFSLNAEITLIVYDPQVVADLRREQEANLAESDLLTAAQWACRSFRVKILQNTARLFDSVL